MCNPFESLEYYCIASEISTNNYQDIKEENTVNTLQYVIHLLLIAPSWGTSPYS